jgi:hypothetical protein
MGLLLDPAALAGLAGLIAVTSWAIGRIQASSAAPWRRTMAWGATPSEPPQLTKPPSAPRKTGAALLPAACQQRALEERRAVLAHPFVLAEIHAEACAIRRSERILCPGPGHDPLLAEWRGDIGRACRFMGLSGQPTCPVVTRSRCILGHDHPSPQRPGLGTAPCPVASADVQPLADGSSFTRV